MPETIDGALSQAMLSTFDLASWTVDLQAPLAAHRDLAELLRTELATLNSAVTQHEPFDHTASWEDVAISLPDTGARDTQRGLSDDEEQAVRSFLRTALEEGRIGREQFEDVHFDGSSERQSHLQHALLVAVGDLGVVVDDHPQHSHGHGDNTASPGGYHDSIDDAIAFLASDASGIARPFALYGKEARVWPLLTAEQEITLAAQLRRGVEDAVRAAACSGPVRNALLNDVIADNVPALIREIKTLVDAYRFNRRRSAQLEESLKRLVADFFIIRRLLEASVASVGSNQSTVITAHDINVALLRAYEGLVGLTQANLRLVISIANRYVRPTVLRDDLVQAGNLGLMDAALRFDPDRGFRFSTWATWWIRQRVQRYIADHGRVIRLPVHLHDRISTLKRAQAAHERRWNRAASLDELAASAGLTEQQVRRALFAEPHADPLEWPIDPSSPQHANGPAYDGLNPEESMMRQDLQKHVALVLRSVTPREEHVIRLRFGFTGDGEHTLEQVGQRFGITRERVRQIEAKALSKLRHPSRARRLRAWLHMD